MRTTDFLPAPLNAALARELGPAEKVLWSGMALPRVDVAMFAVWIFALPFTAFSLFWTYMAASGAGAGDGTVGPAIWVFPLMGLPFLAIGTILLGLPFLPLVTARGTAFAITNRRLLRLRLTRRRLDVQSVAIADVREVKRSEAPSGEGRLIAVHGEPVIHRRGVRDRTFAIATVADVMAADRALRGQIELLSCGSSTPT